MYNTYLWIGLLLLISIVIIEIWRPTIINEGFSNLVSIGDSAFWAKWIPRRGDVGLNPTEEEEGYIRDIRYFSGYTDIQRIGVNHDFCRMIAEESDPTDLFFACALGGTEGLSTVDYKTPSVKDGFELSRDDYMNNVGEERDGYCRILKTGADTFEAKCNPAGDFSFKDDLVVDSNPPEKIRTLLSFYEGIVFWLRLRDDMLDYAKNIQLGRSGGIVIKESPPNPDITDGLEFNGIDQYLKIGDTKDLTFGDIVQLRYLRAISFWVYFEEFTNNAHIIDFGNGAGKDNIFIGIIGRGNPGVQENPTRVLCENQENNTVPAPPSGQQCIKQVNYKKNFIDPNEWDCPDPEIFGKRMKQIQPKKAKEGETKTADLLYEIWDERQRKLHVQVKNAIPLRKWVHIIITATTNDAFKTPLTVYRNGKLIHTEANGWLPQTNYTTSNYIGKSNWTNVTSPYENADELFKGKLFDLRGYNIPMNSKKRKDTYNWGKDLLGLT